MRNILLNPRVFISLTSWATVQSPHEELWYLVPLYQSVHNGKGCAKYMHIWGSEQRSFFFMLIAATHASTSQEQWHQGLCFIAQVKLGKNTCPWIYDIWGDWPPAAGITSYLQHGLANVSHNRAGGKAKTYLKLVKREIEFVSRAISMAHIWKQFTRG